MSTPTKPIRARPTSAVPDPPHETLRDLERHVAANLDGDLSLVALARRAGMSPSCFSRWFRDRARMTPHAYVVAARIERAKALLERSELPLLEIALAVGFSSQSCLSVTFRRRTGMTPNAYRRRVSTKTKDGDGEAVRSSTIRASLRPDPRRTKRTRSAR